MAERDIPELVKFVIDNRDAKNMAASLANFKTDMDMFLRTVESSSQALDFFQSKLKQINTDPKSKDFGMGIQEIIVDARDADVVEQALIYKNASFSRKDPSNPKNILESPYSITSSKVATISGTTTLHGEEAFKQAQEKIRQQGGDIWRAPTNKNVDRVKYFFPTGVAEDKKQVEALKHKMLKEAQKTSKASLGYEAWEREDKDAARKMEEEKEKSDESAAKTSHVIKSILAVVTVIADIARRILTATLTNASETNRKTIEAQNVGMSYAERRNMDIFDIAHGMERGTLFSAVSSIQSKFGDVTKLDTNALGVLARVMGNEVGDLVRSGLGGKNPDVLMEKILDKYFAQYKAGKNSLGQTVGQAQARRELVTVLQSVSPELATIFSRMVDDSLSGRYGNFSTVREWRGTTITNRGDLGESDLTLVSEIGKTWNEIRAATNDIKDLWMNKIIISLNGLLKDVDNLRIGMSATQNIKTDESNREKNTEALQRGNQLMTGYSSQLSGAVRDFTTSTPTALRGVENYAYTPEILAGILSGTYDVRYFKTNNVSGTGMLNPSSEAAKYVARGKEIIKNMLASEAQDELAMAAALSVALEKLWEQQSKGSGENISDESFTTSNLVVQSKKFIQEATKEMPKLWKDVTPELKKGITKGYASWLIGSRASATETFDLADLIYSATGEETLGGSMNRTVVEAAKRKYGRNYKRKIKDEIQKRVNEGMDLREAQADVLAPLGVEAWYHAKNERIAGASSSDRSTSEYHHVRAATLEDYWKSLESSSSKIQSLLLQQTSIPQNASSWTGNTNQNGVYIVQFKNESGTVINSVELGKLGEVGQMEGVIRRDDNGNMYFENK